MQPSIEQIRQIMVEAIRPFTLDRRGICRYSKSLNDIPLFDIFLNFNESFLLFTQEKESDAFSKEESSAIENLAKKVSQLPPESDMFWDKCSVDSVRWSQVRECATSTLNILKHKTD